MIIRRSGSHSPSDAERECAARVDCAIVASDKMTRLTMRTLGVGYVTSTSLPRHIVGRFVVDWTLNITQIIVARFTRVVRHSFNLARGATIELLRGILLSNEKTGEFAVCLDVSVVHCLHYISLNRQTLPHEIGPTCAP